MAKPDPGRDQEMAQRTRKLNLVFALTSIALLVILSVMIWVDYDREWKKYQTDFNKLEVKYTEEQVQAALGKVDANRRKELEAELQKGEQEIAARRDDVNKARAEYDKLDGEWYGIDQNFRFTKAKIDVARYEYEEAAHHGDSGAQRKKKKLDDLEEQWRQWRLKLEDVIARRDAAQAKLNGLEATKLDAEKKQKELFAEYDRLQGRLRKIQPGVFVSFVRNLPVLDLANPSLKVNQVMPANLFDDVVFSPTPKVDRCTTCHLAIDKKGFENEKQPYRTHPDMDTYLRGAHPIERIGCTACHQGRGRATSFLNAAHTASSTDQEKAWGRYVHKEKYDGLHYWDLPMMAKGHTEAQCAKCHQGVVEVPKANRLNAGLMLVERYGCYGCHKIKGWENIRKAGPDLTKITTKTNPEWMFRWIKEPRGFRTTRMPQIWDVRLDETAEQKARNDVEINAVVSYLAEKAAGSEYPDPPKGDLDAGRKTFETVGCLACHVIGEDKRGIEGIPDASFRRHGPHLDGTGSKVKAGWLYAWVRNPKGYWHDTKMPNLRLTEKEAADITAFLMGQKNDGFVARPRPALDTGVRDAIVGEYLRALYSVKQADEKLASMDDHARTLFVGEKTIGRYGCFGCHTISGFEKTSPIGVELTEEGSKLVERLDFGFEEGKIAHTLPAWVHRKLMEPRVFDKDKVKRPEELLRMGKFHVTDEEADAIVTAVMSFTKEQVPLAAQKQLSADDKYVEKGRRLVRNYNCQGCHQIGDKGGTIKAVIQDQLESSGGDVLNTVALSPPLLYNEKARSGEGARVQTPWLHTFLQDPSNKIRPWLQLRMPTFEFTEEETNAITQYFAAQDGVPYPYQPKPAKDGTLLAAGRDLFTKWQCIKCHVVAGKLPNQEPANMAPDLARVPERLRADWIGHWLEDPGKIQPGTRMPSNFPVDPQENAYPDILGGDQKKQIEAVRSYLLTLGPTGGSEGR
jgi:mono/diheme cytochrome c family protein